MIRHTVALRFRADVTAATKAGNYEALRSLSRHPRFLSFENLSVERPLVRGFNDLFWFDFPEAGVRDAYLADPAHQQVGGRVVAGTEGGADGVFVVDVEL